MSKLKTYKTFEGKTIEDVNYEKEIDAVLENLVEKKTLISMLGDTINHVCDKVEEVFPKNYEDFESSLYEYENDIYNRVQEIKENLIDGFPNIKEMIEVVENDITEIEEYLKNKKK